MSKKRPLELDDTINNNDDDDGNNKSTTSRATHAQELKRRQIQQSNWGFRQVLVECGLLEFASSSSSTCGDNDDNDNTRSSSSPTDGQQLGCRLDPTVSPSSLRSSLYALLSEMSKNGIDTNNERVLKDMEEIILGTTAADENNAGAGDNGEGDVSGGGGGGGSLLRKMLLPMYRVKTRQSNPFTQFSQSPDEGLNINASGTNNSKTVVESSSLIKVLLRIDVLQPTLVTALMQKLPELAAAASASSEDDNDNDNMNMANQEMESDVPRLIFSNLRWLDHIVDYGTFTNAYVECLTILASSSASCNVTRGILLDAISALPDVLNDAGGGGGGSWMMATAASDSASMDEDDDDAEDGNDQGEEDNPILSTLQQLRIEDSTLLIPVLDALGSLPLTEDQMESVVRDALEAMTNVETWGLPALTTFLMNHTPGKGDLAKEIIEEMRKLPLGSADTDEEDGMDVDDTHNSNRQSSANTSSLLIESISRGFAHRPDLTSVLLKAIKDPPSIDENTSGCHLPADIWLLACCASAPHNRAKIKSIFKSKANCGLFTTSLMRQSLVGNGMALTSLFGTSLCDLADGLLRSGSSISCGDSSATASCDLGVTLYQILFEEFTEPMQRQEIVGALVTHVGSGVGLKCKGEVDAALKVFCGIVDAKNKGSGAMGLRPFTPFLTSMLDHLHHMTTGQVRRLFLLLFAVGGGDGDGGDGDLDGGLKGTVCDIVIRKHLGFGPFAKKRIGIIGTVAYAVSRSTQLQEQQSIIDEENGIAETEATCLPGSAAVAASPIVKEIQELIEEAYDKCKPARGSLSTATSSNDRSNGMTKNRVVSSINSSAGPAFSDGAAMAFLFDELSQAVRGGRLTTPIRSWLDAHFQSEFEEWYVGDFEENEEDEQPTAKIKGTKGGDDIGMLDSNQIPTSSTDLALLNGSSTNANAPLANLRFAIDGCESCVYVKILSLLSSEDRTESSVLPVTLSPLFRLMSTLSDVRFGGEGLSEIDAMLECPLILPSSECADVEFDDLSAKKQWVVTGSCFFGCSWIRQLINSFIYAAEVDGNGNGCTAAVAGTPAAKAGSFTSSSQGFNSDEVQKKIVARLKALVELEEELRFTASKCFVFAPPGLDVLSAPKDLFNSDNGSYDDTENQINLNADPSTLSKEDRKALTAARKMATKRAKEKATSKQKRLKAKQKHEQQLVARTMGALRPLDPQVCIALGFEELALMNNAEGGVSQSQALSQFQQDVTSAGGQVTTLLLNLLQKTLSDSLSEKKGGGLAFMARVEGKSDLLEEEDVDDNPYMAKEQENAATFAGLALASCEESSKKSFAMLDNFLRGGVFASLYEHLSAVTELRCGLNSKDDDAETESQLVGTARCLFSCLRSVLEAELLTRSATGKSFLAAIFKQIAEGDRNDYASENKRRRRPTSASMNKTLGYIMINVNEILTGCYTGDLEFAMDGVNCMHAIFECSKRISDTTGAKRNDDDEENETNFSTKLSDVAHKLLRQNWPDDTKLNKGNVGKLLSLLVEHSSNRVETLSCLVSDVLTEVPHLEKGHSVTPWPTCSHQTFGCYFSAVLEYLVKELVKLFESPWGKTKDPNAAAKAIASMNKMIELMHQLFKLTRDNDTLAKKAILLQQLKFGSRFIETFVSKAMPFFQTHFEIHEESVLSTIQNFHRWSRNLYHIIAHGKREKDANLAKEAPRAKKALEMFIHKVKAMLKKNKCMTAMWTKELKTKDIDGTTLKEEKEADDDEDGGDSENGSEDEEEGSEGDGADSSDEYETAEED